MAGTFWRVQNKLGRAKEHVEEVKEQLRAFLEGKPYPLVFQTQMHGLSSATVHARILIEDELPVLALSNAFGDAVHNLRSTLDYLVWELTVRKLGYRPRTIEAWHRKVGFPIFNDPSEFRFTSQYPTGPKAKGGRAIPMLRGVTRDQWARIKTLQPFGKPNHSLSLLADLDNIDKHRHAHLMVGAHRVQIRRERVPHLRVFNIKLHPGGAIQNNTQVARVRISRKDFSQLEGWKIESDVDMCLQRSFAVTFDQGGPVAGEDLSRVLSRLQRHVSGIVNQFRNDFLDQPRPLHAPPPP